MPEALPTSAEARVRVRAEPQAGLESLESAVARHSRDLPAASTRDQRCVEILAALSAPGNMNDCTCRSCEKNPLLPLRIVAPPAPYGSQFAGTESYVSTAGLGRTLAYRREAYRREAYPRDVYCRGA